MTFRAHEKANRLNAEDSVLVDRESSTTGSTLVSQLLDMDNMVEGADALILTAAERAAIAAAASQLSELSDVGDSTPTAQNALMADGDSWESRPFVEADISDLGTTIAVKDGDGYVDQAIKAHYLEDDVRKGSPGTISVGTPVYIFGYNPAGFVEVEECDADDHDTLPCVGLAAEDITNAADAEIVLAGELDGWDTSSWSAGAILWVASGGGLTATEPEGGAYYKQAVAVVLRSHATLGAVFVIPWAHDIHLPNFAIYDQKVTPVAGDRVLIEDSEDGYSAKYALKSEFGGGLADIVDDTTPQLGGSLDVNGQKVVSVSNGDIDIEPNGTGNVLLGNFTFDADQAVGAGQDDYVLTYDDGSGVISLEAAASGDVVDDTTPQLGGSLDVNGQKIVSVSDGDIDIEPDGLGNVLLGNFTFYVSQTVGAGQDNYVLTYDDGLGTISLEAATGGGLADVVDDTTPQLGGDLDVNGQRIVSASNGDIEITPDGTGNVGIGTGSPAESLDIYGKVALNGTQVLYNAEGEDSFTGTLYVGDGGGSLSHTAGVEGYFNTAFGFEALANNTTGAYNNASGYSTLNANTTGDKNSAIGYNSLHANTDGDSNSAIGFNALHANTTGNNNSAIGSSALYSNISGTSNNAIGYNALYNNTTGTNNIAIGANALLSATDGTYNSAIGSNALRSNTTGDYNSAVGNDAGHYIADGSTPNATPNYSVYIGSYTKALADGDSNEIVIGYNAIGIGSNSVVLGNDSIATTALKGKVGIGVTGPDTALDVNGAITARELSADPSDPDEGSHVIWQSDGTGSGDDGDIMMKITAGGSTKTITLVDFSAA